MVAASRCLWLLSVALLLHVLRGHDDPTTPSKEKSQSRSLRDSLAKEDHSLTSQVSSLRFTHDLAEKINAEKAHNANEKARSTRPTYMANVGVHAPLNQQQLEIGQATNTAASTEHDMRSSNHRSNGIRSGAASQVMNAGDSSLNSDRYA